MRVFQINTKSRSPINTANNIINFRITKNKTPAKNNTKRTRNNNDSKNKNIFKKNILYNYNKHKYHYLSNDYSQINTTNFNNSKTNNFIFFENTMNYKENELFKQIKSLIKHNSSNNISNIKFINNNININKKDTKNKPTNKKEKININRKFSDKITLNKTNKLSISSNYSLLMKNKENKNGKIPKLKYIKLNILNPLSLNFSNEINNPNSFRKLLTNKSTKFFNNYKLNDDLLKKAYTDKRAKSTERKKIKSNSKDKISNNNKILITNNRIFKNAKSYNDIIYSYIKSISKSSSFSPRRKNENKYLDKKKDKIEPKLSHQKHSSRKITDVNNKINLQYFKSKNEENNIFIKNRLSPVSSKMIDVKLYTRKFKNKKIEIKEVNNNNTFLKNNKRIIKNKKVIIFTPEENHFLAVSNLQKIKSYGNNFN